MTTETQQQSEALAKVFVLLILAAIVSIGMVFLVRSIDADAKECRAKGGDFVMFQGCVPPREVRIVIEAP